jgi:hypothetical protein
MIDDTFDPSAIQQQAQALFASGMTEEQVIEALGGGLVEDNCGDRQADPTPEEIAA